MASIHISGDIHGEVILHEDQVYAIVQEPDKGPQLPLLERIVLPVFTYTEEVVQLNGLWYRLKHSTLSSPTDSLATTEKSTAPSSNLDLSLTSKLPLSDPHIPQEQHQNGLAAASEHINIQQRLTELAEYESRLGTWASQLLALDNHLRAREAQLASIGAISQQEASIRGYSTPQDEIEIQRSFTPFLGLDNPFTEFRYVKPAVVPEIAMQRNSLESVSQSSILGSASLPEISRPPKRPPPNPPKISLLSRSSGRLDPAARRSAPPSAFESLSNSDSILYSTGPYSIPGALDSTGTSIIRPVGEGVRATSSSVLSENIVSLFQQRLPPLMRASPNVSLLKFAKPTVVSPNSSELPAFNIRGAGNTAFPPPGSGRPLASSSGSNGEGGSASEAPSSPIDRSVGIPSAPGSTRAKRLMKHVASASSEDGTSDAIRFSNRRATIATSALYYTGPESKEWDLVGFEGWRLSNNLAKPEAHIVGDASGKNPLMIAIQNGTFGAVKFMLKTYKSLADRINKPDTFGRIPLLVACASDSLEVLQLLVEYGADVVNTRSSNGDTCLHESAGNESILSFLLVRVPQSMVDTCTSNGVTPLECAIVKKSAACVKMLVDKGSNQRSHSSNTKVPYVAAASTGDVKMIHHLSHKCLTPDEIQDALREAAKSFNGSACFKAIAQSTMCRLDVPNPSSHNLPLVWTAAVAGSLDIVRFLVEERGLGKDLAWLDEERRCIVLESARLGRSDLVQYLIAHGASPDIADKEGRTVLHKIISSLAFLPTAEQLAQGLEMVQTIVLTSQIDPLRPNNSEFVNFGSSSEDFVVAPLKDRIAQEKRLEFLDRVNNDGESALHYAAKFGLLNITKFLVAAGANRKIKVGKRFIGKTPQELAASTGHTEVALFLGTKPDKGDKGDKSDKGDKGEKLMKPERSRAQTMAPGFTKVPFS